MFLCILPSPDFPWSGFPGERFDAVIFGPRTTGHFISLGDPASVFSEKLPKYTGIDGLCEFEVHLVMQIPGLRSTFQLEDGIPKDTMVNVGLAPI